MKLYSRVRLPNGYWVEKDGQTYYYYGKMLCNRISHDTVFAEPVASWIKKAFDILDREEVPGHAA